MLFRGFSPAASRPARTRALLLASIATLIAASFDARAPAVAQRAAPFGHALAPAGGAEFGARKRVRARRGNPAAGLAVMGMMIGTIGAVIAAQQRREAHEAALARRAYGYPHYSYGHPQPYVPYRPRPHFHRRHSIHAPAIPFRRHRW